MEPADKHQEGECVPKGGEQHPVLLLFAPFGDDRVRVSAIRRFHDLRSFHPRLFTFAPFGDGRTPLAKAGTAEHHLQKFNIIRIQFVLLLEYKRLEYEISNQNEEYNLETYIIYKINIIYEIYVIYETNMIHETYMMHLINMMYLKIFV